MAPSPPLPLCGLSDDSTALARYAAHRAYLASATAADRQLDGRGRAPGCRHWATKGTCKLGNACAFSHCAADVAAAAADCAACTGADASSSRPPAGSRPGRRRGDGARAEKPEAVAVLPERDRCAILTASCAERLPERLRQQGKCERCALTVQHCICACLAGLRETIKGHRRTERLRWAVWMHVRERGRASNTGKLLEHLLPGCEVFLHGIAADLERFRQRVADVGGRAFVLFPSSDAVSMAAAMAPTLAGDGSSVGPCVMVLIDGTWRQARHMVRQPEFQGLTRIALADCGRSEFHWRRQSQEGRISTVEAGAYLLEEYLALQPRSAAGDPGAEGCAPIALRQALAALNTALEQQSHCDALQEPIPDVKGERSEGNRLPKPRLGQRGVGM